jgi:hypothetical protein
MNFEPISDVPVDTGSSFEPISNTPIVPEPTSVKARSIIDEIKAQQDTGMKFMSSAGAGILEQPATIAGSLGSMAVTGIESLVTAAVKPDSVMAGQNFYERFNNDYQKRNAGYQENDPFAPQTDAGKHIAESLGNVFNTVLQGFGDINYNMYHALGNVKDLPPAVKDFIQQDLAPVMGTGAQAIIMLGSLAGIKGEKSSTGNIDPVAKFAADNPEAALHMEAAAVGTPPSAVPSGKSVVDTATMAVDKELGITLDVLAQNPTIANMPLAEKIQTLVQKKAIETGVMLPPDVLQKYANDVTGQLTELQTLESPLQKLKRLEQERIDARNIPREVSATTGQEGADFFAANSKVRDGVPVTGGGEGKAFFEGAAAGRASIKDNAQVKVEAKAIASADAEKAKWENVQQDVAATQAKKIMEGNMQALQDSRKVQSGIMIKNARRRIYSHNYDLKADLRKLGTPEGNDAFYKIVLQPGATMAAKVQMNHINEAIFDKLSHTELWQTNEITRLRRVVQIDKYKGIGVVRHEDGLTGPMAAARLTQMKQDLGAGFDKVNNAATSIFEQQKVLLKKLQDAGLETPEVIASMENLDYTRTQYLNKVDPEIPIISRIKGMKTSISSSGIAKMGRGKQDFVNIDAQQLLMEDVARVENRIFRNNTLQAVRTLAERMPTNGIVELPGPKAVSYDKAGNATVKHVPEGFTAIGVRVGGKQEFVFMKDTYAEQFVARPEAMPEWLSTTVRMVSGSSLIKQTSTGMNPAFMIAGIPMDIMHTWLTSTDVYSAHLPKYLVQMTTDLAATAKDAFTKTGAWEDAMREGIGGSYLAHESRSLTDPSKSVHTQISARLEKTRTAMSYLNDTTDMWIRLAYRNRLMREGGGDAIDSVTGKMVKIPMDSAAATALARDRLDYFWYTISKCIGTGYWQSYRSWCP